MVHTYPNLLNRLTGTAAKRKQNLFADIMRLQETCFVPTSLNLILFTMINSNKEDGDSERIGLETPIHIKKYGTKFDRI